MVQQVKSKAEFEEALKHENFVIVDFFATWCGPCKMIAPMVEKFSTQYSDDKFIKLDIDEVSEVAQEYEVSSMPTFLIFKNGEVVEKMIGANPGNLKKILTKVHEN